MKGSGKALEQGIGPHQREFTNVQASDQHKHHKICHTVLPQPDHVPAAMPVPVGDAKQQQHPGCLAAGEPGAPTACCCSHHLLPAQGHFVQTSAQANVGVRHLHYYKIGIKVCVVS